MFAMCIFSFLTRKQKSIYEMVKVFESSVYSLLTTIHETDKMPWVMQRLVRFSLPLVRQSSVLDLITSICFL